MMQFLAVAKSLTARAFGFAAKPGAFGPARLSPDDGLLAFHAEGSTGLVATSEPQPFFRRRIVVVCAATALSLTSTTVVYVATTRSRATRPAVASAPLPGMAVLDSHPSAIVTIDGVARGSTPLSLQLSAGRHTLIVVAAGQASRTISLDVRAGETTRQSVEFADAPPAAVTGRLEVTSEPPGARVTVDGAPRGTTPFTIGEIAAGPHQLTISSGDTTIRRRVTVEAGAMSSVDATIAAPDSAAGWLALTSPVELTLAEDDQIIGTTKAARVMLPAGTHNLVLANAALEFQTTLTVRVDGGKTMKRAITLPNGSLSVNAAPWANVSVDGTDVGTTPLANVTLPIGTHEVLWRHPQLGERRRTIAITAKTPTRIGMDFKQ